MEIGWGALADQVLSCRYQLRFLLLPLYNLQYTVNLKSNRSSNQLTSSHLVSFTGSFFGLPFLDVALGLSSVLVKLFECNPAIFYWASSPVPSETTGCFTSLASFCWLNWNGSTLMFGEGSTKNSLMTMWPLSPFECVDPLQGCVFFFFLFEFLCFPTSFVFGFF